ncbi:MAG TPA: hypothetical protein DD706_06710 [Nitrospiraceae bacterium]|nr:hypothetical protein [Nitrospiraceae bacterium]
MPTLQNSAKKEKQYKRFQTKKPDPIEGVRLCGKTKKTVRIFCEDNSLPGGIQLIQLPVRNGKAFEFGKEVIKG